MILKIRGSRLDNNRDSDYYDWSFYDNLTGVRYQFTPCFGNVNAGCIRLSDRDEGTPVIPDTVFPQYEGKSIEEDPGVIVFARDARDQEVCFWIATESYLLNDNGKTIERLMQ